MLIAQHVGSRFTGYQLGAEQLFISPGEQPDTRKDDEQVAGKRGDLAAGYLSHSNCQVVQIRLMGILPGVQGTGYCAGREGGLFGRQRGMGLFDKDETQAVIDAVGEAMPEDGHRQADEEVLDQHDEADPCPAAHGAPYHGPVFRPGGCDIFISFSSLVLGNLVGEIAQGLGHKFEDTVLPVLVTDQHAEQLDEFPDVEPVILIDQVYKDGHPLHPVGQQQQHIGLVKRGAALAVMLADIADALITPVKQQSELARKLAQRREGFRGARIFIGSDCQQGGRAIDIQYRLQFMYQVVLPDKGIVIAVFFRNILQHLFFKPQLCYLEREGLERGDQLMHDAIVVDMQGQAQAFEELYPVCTGNIFDPLVVIITKKDPVKNIKEVMFIL